MMDRNPAEQGEKRASSNPHETIDLTCATGSVGTPIGRMCETPGCDNRTSFGENRCQKCRRRVFNLPSSNPTPTLDVRPQYHTSRRAREYKCPCGGEFDSWERRKDRDGEPLVCPFCGTEKYARGNDGGAD